MEEKWEKKERKKKIIWISPDDHGNEMYTY